jgi:hypothetical protein
MKNTEEIFGSAGTYRTTVSSGNSSSFSHTGSSYLGLNTLTAIKDPALNVYTFGTVMLAGTSQPALIINNANTIISPLVVFFRGNLSSYGYSQILKPFKITGYPGVFHHYNLNPTVSIDGNIVSYLSSSSSSTKSEIKFGTYISYIPETPSSNQTGQEPQLDFSPRRQSDITYSRDIVTRTFSRYTDIFKIL